jgi:hypothetical protein
LPKRRVSFCVTMAASVIASPKNCEQSERRL